MGIIEAKDVKYSYTSEENITPALTGVDLVQALQTLPGIGQKQPAEKEKDSTSE